MHNFFAPAVLYVQNRNQFVKKSCVEKRLEIELGIVCVIWISKNISGSSSRLLCRQKQRY